MPMYRAYGICTFVLLVGCSLLIAQDEAKLQSGPKKGDFIPKPFECFNINGPAKGRPHCLVCKFALYPAVLIFAKEPMEGKDKEFTELLAKLDETAEKFEERNFLAGVVILSPDARDSTNNAGETKVEDILTEAVKREKLVKGLTARAEKLKHVILATYPLEGPKDFKLNPKAEITVLFYERLKVIENYAYAPGAMESQDVDKMVERIREALPLKKKPAAEK
jgi:hypothetical protein